MTNLGLAMCMMTFPPAWRDAHMGIERLEAQIEQVESLIFVLDTPEFRHTREILRTRIAELTAALTAARKEQ